MISLCGIVDAVTVVVFLNSQISRLLAAIVEPDFLVEWINNLHLKIIYIVRDSVQVADSLCSFNYRLNVVNPLTHDCCFCVI